MVAKVRNKYELRTMNYELLFNFATIFNLFLTK